MMTEVVIKFILIISSSPASKAGLPDFRIFGAKPLTMLFVFLLFLPFVFFVYLTTLMTIWLQKCSDLATLIQSMYSSELMSVNETVTCPFLTSCNVSLDLERETKNIGARRVGLLYLTSFCVLI